MMSANLFYTYGPPELCVWKIGPGTFWFQTTEPEYSRKLGQRQDTRRVGITGVNHYRRTYEMSGTWLKVKRIVDRYLMPTSNVFSSRISPLGCRRLPRVSTRAGGRPVSNVSDLREKIDEAKRRLPMPELMAKLGLGEHARKEAHCPFHHPDAHPSFSVFQKTDGAWWHKCFVGCSEGDEIMFLKKLKGLPATKAMALYLEMAGFPPLHPGKSREYPKCPESPMSLAYPVSPVSNGQGVNHNSQNELRVLAGQNACTRLNTARPRRFKLLRDLKAVQKRIKRKLQPAELTIAFDEWHRLSLCFLDPAKTRDYYEAKFLSEFSKVRFATGDGTLMTALENVASLSPGQLPGIPGKLNAPESWRRLAALHRELSRLRGKPTHFLGYRDAARVFERMSHQEAHTITGALETLGVINIVRKGKAGLNTGEAAEFRCLLPLNGEVDAMGLQRAREQAACKQRCKHATQATTQSVQSHWSA